MSHQYRRAGTCFGAAAGLRQYEPAPGMPLHTAPTAGGYRPAPMAGWSHPAPTAGFKYPAPTAGSRLGMPVARVRNY